MVAPAARCHCTTASLSVRSQIDRARAGSAGSSMSAQALGDAHVVGVDHAGHAFAHDVQVVELGLDEQPGVEGPVSRRVAAGDAELRVRLEHVVLLHERLFGQLPVDREPERVPPLGPHRLELPGVHHRRERLDALAQGRCRVVEVDPGAPTPGLAPHRHEIDVVGLQVVLGERAPLRNEGVAAVEAVAPPVERTREPVVAGAPTLDELHAPVATGVLEGPHLQSRSCARTTHGLVEDLVLDEVVRRRDLLEPARHLPHPRPQRLGLHAVEVRVEVALLRHPVRHLHGERYGQAPPTRPRRQSDATPCWSITSSEPLDVELVAVGPELGEQLDQLAPLLLGEADAPVHLGVEVTRRVDGELAPSSRDDGERGARVGRVRHPSHELVGLEPVDEVGHRRRRDAQRLADPAERERRCPGRSPAMSGPRTRANVRS